MLNWEPVDGVDSEHGVAANVCVTVLKTIADGWHQWLEQFGLLQLA